MDDFLSNYVFGRGACLLRGLVFVGAVGFGRTAPGDRFDSSDPVVGVRADQLRTIRFGSLGNHAIGNPPAANDLLDNFRTASAAEDDIDFASWREDIEAVVVA